MKLISHILILTLLSSYLVGCASLSDVTEVRQLPGLTWSFKEAQYDPSILSFRESAQDSDSTQNKRVLRDSLGKKIMSEDELSRLKQASETKVLDKGTIGTSYVLIAIYLPVAVAVGAVESIIMIPWTITFNHYSNVYRNNTEEKYIAGRSDFDKGQYESALANLEYARVLMPSMIAFSDVDYWRGRTFEQNIKNEDALASYRTFIEYSESSVPTYFNKKFSDDPSWLEKANDAKQRIANLKMILNKEFSRRLSEGSGS